MIILRLETSDHAGIYYSCMWSEILGTVGNTPSSIHPMAFEDITLTDNISGFILNNISDFDTISKMNPEFNDLFCCNLRFGFSDPYQYKMWVFEPEWRSKLAQAGINLCFYDIDERHVLKGDSQVVFLKDYATLVSKVPPTYFDGETVYAAA